MKTLVFSLFIFLSVHGALTAQDYIPFPDTNTMWVEGRWFDMGGGWPPADTAFWFLKTNGKMSINDTVYTILGQPGFPESGFIREEAQKVYFRYSNTTPEFLAFDFTLEEGDTVNLPLDYGGQTWPSYVVDVDSVLIGQHYRKRIFIDAWIGITFIEGVGCEQGLLYFEIPWVDWSGFTKCFSVNDTIYDLHGSGAMTPGHCWLYLDIPETRPEAISIYPNPARDRLYVTGCAGCRLELYNTQGQIISMASGSMLDLSKTPGGIYILRVYAADGTLVAQRKVVRR